jgi:predicted O-methyltransferase YrrM
VLNVFQSIFAKIHSLDLIHPLAASYAEKFSSGQDGLLKEIAEHTYAHHPHAHMLSGAVQGQFLQMISRLLRPSRILEIGTFTGYSALCLAAGLSENGRLHTIECRNEDAARAREYFNRSNLGDRIILHPGKALAIIPLLQEAWDLVFIDADKTNYSAYYDLVLPQLRPGGLIIADNVLFHGQVLEEEIEGKNARAIHAFNERVKNDPSVEEVLLTVRDGLLLIRKK